MLRIKDFFAGRVRFQVRNFPLSGLNRLRAYQITQIEIIEGGYAFSVPLAHLSAVKRLVTKFDWQVSENYNLFRGFNYLLNHYLLVVMIMVCFSVYLVLNLKIYDVKVRCDDTTLTSEIYRYLQSQDIKKFTWKGQIQNAVLANNLVDHFGNIAHANVRIAGNTLLVDLVTATNEPDKVKTNIYARYDAVIKEVIAYSGTSLVTVGDVVKKGDLLVTDAYQDSVVIIGEVAFINDAQITRLDISII